MHSIIINRLLRNVRGWIFWYYERTDNKEKEMAMGPLTRHAALMELLFNTILRLHFRPRYEINVPCRGEDHHSTAVILRMISAANSFEAAGPFAVMILPSVTTDLFTRTAPPIFISRNDNGFS